MAYTLDQFNVLWCTETPLRQDITPLYETKILMSNSPANN